MPVSAGRAYDVSECSGVKWSQVESSRVEPKKTTATCELDDERRNLSALASCSWPSAAALMTTTQAHLQIKGPDLPHTATVAVHRHAEGHRGVDLEGERLGRRV